MTASPELGDHAHTLGALFGEFRVEKKTLKIAS